MTSTQAYIWAAIAIVLVVSFVLGFALLLSKLARAQGQRNPEEQDDQLAPRRRY
ncbi:hypothetical protein ACSI5F_03760 [Ralstonia pseudosolanacearum]|uniref:hypothetical protein n=1 Tax=Ralstonia pseudosolanacearum TaxID=1310165 RepID=UPI003EDF4AE5